MNKQIIFNEAAKEKLKAGIDKLADAVVVTLGPSGRNVVIEKEDGTLHLTKDGVTVAKSISIKDPVENIGIQMVKQASIKVAEIAGDGTTTTTLLARNLINNGFDSIKSGSNAIEVKKGMEEASKLVVEELRKLSKDIGENQLNQVATISANGDEEIGNLVSTSMDKVGRDGIVTVEESRTGETSLEIVEGIQFERGYKSHLFVTDNNSMQATLNDAYILLYDKPIVNADTALVQIMQAVADKGKSLLIIAEDIEGQALATLVVNKARGTIKVAAVKSPGFGDKRMHLLEDIATLTGGTVVSDVKGMKLEEFDTAWFGEARVITVGRDTTTIVDGKGNVDKITARMLELKNQIDKSQSPYEIEQLQDRLSRMAGGVAIINVGGANELEIKEKTDRVDDALQATKAAIEEGIVPGGGIALFRVRHILFKNSKKLSEDKKIGYGLVFDACAEPFRQILLNAGYDTTTIEDIGFEIESKRDKWRGFNPRKGKQVNMFDAGIVDPTKVTRCALENAVAVAASILTTECVVSNDIEEKANQQPNFDI